MKTLIRTESHTIHKNNDYFEMIKEFCHLSKNLYNHANYIIRQNFFGKEDGKYISYYDMCKLITSFDDEYNDYRAMPFASSAQQTLKVLNQNWKSWFISLKDFKENPSKYKARPKPPKYLDKNGYFPIILTNQNVKLKEDILYFPKSFKGLTLQPRCIHLDNFNKINQVHLSYHGTYAEIRITYEIEVQDIKIDSDNVIGIDLGIDNLVTVANTFEDTPFIISGKPIKSRNQWYNKQIAYYGSIANGQQANKNIKLKYTNKMNYITNKRNRQVNDYLHKTARKIINYCIEHQVSEIIIGQNKGWKQECNIGKKNNQKFIEIPHAKLISMIQYLAEEFCITVTLTEESYTSGTSFIDNEEPTKENYNKKRRITRGMFKSNNGTLINADLNAAYQIIKKCKPIKWSSGCGLQPVMVGIE